MNGDGFVVGPDGIPRWGRYGAAGLLLRHTDEHGVRRYLLAERGPFVQHPHTWAFPGGALRSDETPEQGALREATEEFGNLPAHSVAEVIVDRPAGAGGWAYWTVIGDVVGRVALAAPTNHENTGRTCWVTVEEMSRLPLHPGVGALADRSIGAVLRRPMADDQQFAPFPDFPEETCEWTE